MKLIIYGCTEQPIKIVSRLRRIAKQNIEILGFLDTDRTRWGTNYWGYPVFGGLEKVKDFKSKAKFCNCISRTSEQRKQITDGILENGGELMSLIDPEIDLEFVKVGNGVYIQEGTYIQAGVEIGDYVTIHMGTMIAHGTKIEKNAMLTFACNITGGFVGEGAAIYTGANIAAKIGKWSVIGAGSVVVNEIPEYSLAYGNPAKVIKKLEKGHQVH